MAKGEFIRGFVARPLRISLAIGIIIISMSASVYMFVGAINLNLAHGDSKVQFNTGDKPKGKG